VAEQRPPVGASGRDEAWLRRRYVIFNIARAQEPHGALSVAGVRSDIPKQPVNKVARSKENGMRRLRPVLVLTVSAALVLVSNAGEARSRPHHVSKHQYGFKKTSAQVKKYRLTKSTYFAKRFSHAKKVRTAASRSISLAGVTPVLAAKARQVASDCGSAIISAVSGRGIRSNHPIGRAVDMRGNPGCIYAHLKGWPGGYSTDYAAAGHVHISYNPGGQEWGLRFAHNGGGHSYGRVASRGIGRHASRSYARSIGSYPGRSIEPGGVQQSPMVYVAALHKPQ
jgi:hypothetical protein